MSYEIRPSVGVSFQKAPIVALAGETGSGKSETAMRIARGYVGPEGKFLVVDTEEKRALYKRARYQPWDWMDLQPPFTPSRYIEALDAGKAYGAVVLDSGSHEYAGPGGLQDMQAEELERLSKGDESKAERLTALAWKKPKAEHKKFMARVMRYPTLLIVCLRAEPKIRFVKDAQGKTQIVDAGYQPICERMFGYEMLVYALLHADNPGIPVHLKKLEPEFEPMFPVGKQLTEESGRQLAAWAKGQAAAQEPRKGVSAEETREAAYVSEAQIEAIHVALSESNVEMDAFLAKAEIPTVKSLLSADANKAIKWIRSQKKAAA